MVLLSTSHHHFTTTFLFSKATPSLSFYALQTTQSLSFPTHRPALLLRTPSFPANRASDADAGISDEWGKKADQGPEPGHPKGADSDPTINEDEWEEKDVGPVDGSLPDVEAPVAGGVLEEGKLWDLKRSLVDTFYATDCGFRASPEIRAEVSELVNQLEALNPTPAPVESPALLDGTWVLLYTAFSELLPLLAVSSIPLLKVEKISQKIDSSNLSIVNSTTFSSPFATVSFSASATFEVRSPSRIQVQFKEGSFEPPEIKSSISLPENVDVFGQTVILSPLQQSLNPLQEAVANISRIISGQPSLKVPIRGNGSRSWLLTTYLDKDLRISRGDGGLFILAKEGSPLLDLAG